MWVIKNRKTFIVSSIILLLSAIFLVSLNGLKFGIEFTGGSLTEVSYPDGKPEVSEIRDTLSEFDLGDFLVQPTDGSSVFIKTRSLGEEEKTEVLNALSVDGTREVKEISFTSIGPSVGKELKNKSILTIILVTVATILFIAYAFRKVSKPVSSWQYGFVAIIALFYDIIMATGIFAIMGNIMGAEVDTLFIVALLTILGLSVNNTIVVFDRVRENLGKKTSGEFKDVVGQSLKETYMRSISTSFSTILVLLSLFFFGPESTKVFSMVLVAGIAFGTYSSIFFATPLLVVFESFNKNKL